MEAMKSRMQSILAEADVRIDGDRPWDIRVQDNRVYQRILVHGSLGLGESFMDGLWDCPQLDEFFHRVLRIRIERRIRPAMKTLQSLARTVLVNRQTRERSRIVAEIHYDLGNEFYSRMLDPYMQYTCAYWKDARDLEEAQIAKLDLVCRKLRLKPGEKVLELGCGWGGFARYAAERYGVEVTSYNISAEQVKYARESTKHLPVTIVHKDYRDAEGVFDKAVSIGMCEHVGFKNYRPFLQLVNQRLRDGGLFLLHTIGGLHSATAMEPWLDKYIFPNAVLPSVKQIGEASEHILVLEDLHNFGPDYDRTLMAWNENFQRNWSGIVDDLGPQFDRRFHRMWTYYLLMCAGSFRARKNQLWQFVFSKGGAPDGYEAVR